MWFVIQKEHVDCHSKRTYHLSIRKKMIHISSKIYLHNVTSQIGNTLCINIFHLSYFIYHLRYIVYIVLHHRQVILLSPKKDIQFVTQNGHITGIFHTLYHQKYISRHIVCHSKRTCSLSLKKDMQYVTQKGHLVCHSKYYHLRYIYIHVQLIR